MARRPREKSNSDIYHVMLRGNNKAEIFHDADDYRKFFLCMRNALKTYGFVIHCYCLMPNHVHLLINTNGKELSTIMHLIESSFATYYNQRYNHIGHVFQGRFRSEPVEDDSYFLQLMQYIHQNPIKAGLCADLDDYPYSSWKEYSTGTLYICDTSYTDYLAPRESVLAAIRNPFDESNVGIDPDTEMKRVARKMSDDEAVTLFIGLLRPQIPLPLRSEPQIGVWPQFGVDGESTKESEAVADAFSQLDQERQNSMMMEANRLGVSVRQLSEITGLNIHAVRYRLGKN